MKIRLFLFFIACVFVVGSWQGAKAQSYDGQDRRVRIINASSFTVWNLYGSNVGRNTWGRDLLGDIALPPGSAATVNFDDGTGYCRYDLKMITSDGQVITKWRVNVCEVTSWTFYND
jgi:hypothetical protein